MDTLIKIYKIEFVQKFITFPIFTLLSSFVIFAFFLVSSFVTSLATKNSLKKILTLQAIANKSFFSIIALLLLYPTLSVVTLMPYHEKINIILHDYESKALLIILVFLSIIYFAILILNILALCLDWHLTNKARKSAQPLEFNGRIRPLEKFIRNKNTLTHLGFLQIRLCVSQDVDSYQASGLLKPHILLPKKLVNTLPAGHLLAIIMHETCHIKYFHYPLLILQRLLKSMFFYDRLLNKICYALDLKCELIADQASINQGIKPKTYAKIIAREAEIISANRNYISRYDTQKNSKNKSYLTKISILLNKFNLMHKSLNAKVLEHRLKNILKKEIK